VSYVFTTLRIRIPEGV